MKKIITFLALILIGVSVNAQYINSSYVNEPNDTVSNSTSFYISEKIPNSPYIYYYDFELKRVNISHMFSVQILGSHDNKIFEKIYDKSIRGEDIMTKLKGEVRVPKGYPYFKIMIIPINGSVVINKIKLDQVRIKTYKPL